MFIKLEIYLYYYDLIKLLSLYLIDYDAPSQL